jgi:putative DNA base modification enzyme with NMAD domain
MAGAGLFTQFSSRLQLTAPGASASEWLLPAWFEPVGDRPPLTYHGDRNRWTRDGEQVRLRSVGRGQEFVLNLSAYPEAQAWLAALFNQAERNACSHKR